MIRQTRALRWAFLAAVGLLVGSGSLSAQDLVEAPDVCERVAIPSLPAGFNRAAWVETRSHILYPNHEEVVALLASGQKGGQLYSERQPFAFSPIGDDFLQFNNVWEDGAHARVDVIWLDKYLRRKGTFSLADPGPGSNFRILALYQWTIAGDYLVGYGYYSMNAQRDSGFFYHRLGRPETGLRGDSRFLFQSGDSQPGDSRLLFQSGSQDYYQAPEPYFSSVGSTAYFLEMEPGHPVKSYRFNPNEGEVQATLLSGFPGEELTVPKPPRIGGRGDYVKYRLPFYDQQHGLPRGLYGQGELLYAVYKNPEQGWHLKQMVPRDDNDTVTVVGTMSVPSEALGISLLPTEDRWFVFEYSVENSVDLMTNAMLVIPEERVTSSHESPLYRSGAKRIRCARR